MIVIMTDESQKWKTVFLDWVFSLWLSILLPIVSLPVSISLLCVLSPLIISSFLFSPHFFHSPTVVFILYLSIHLQSPATLSSFYPSFLHSALPPIFFYSCLSKDCFNNKRLLHNSDHYANLFLINVSKNAFFVRVRANNQRVMFIAKWKHVRGYYNFFKTSLKKRREL